MQQDFFISNRHRLGQQLNGLAVLSAYTQLQLRGDMAHRFEQESNFWYLTGINEPDWWLIIDGSQSKSWLVSPVRSQASQIFDGGMTDDQAQAISGVDAVITRDKASRLLSGLARQHSLVYALGDEPLSSHYDFVVNPAQKDTWRMLDRLFVRVQDCRPELTKLRAIKQPEELAAIKRAVRLTADAFSFVKDRLDDFKYEYEIEAEFSYYFRKYGADGHAYDPIIGRGKNAVTLHYSANQDRIPKNSLILLDIGARLNGYPADITRTYAKGTPTKRQRQVHQAVQQAEAQIISLLGPGVSVQQYHEQVDQIMKQALVDLGLLKSLSDEETYRKYFPHAVSHGLGVDVHDALGRPETFQPGMVLTVEPGIYIPEEGIGVRIEDDILITDRGQSNLSAALSTDLR